MNRIKQAREAKGLSQKEVAITLGVSAPTVSEWESGKKRPRSSKLPALADLLGVSADYLLGTEETKKDTTENGGAEKLIIDTTNLQKAVDVASKQILRRMVDNMSPEEAEKMLALAKVMFGEK